MLWMEPSSGQPSGRPEQGTASLEPCESHLGPVCHHSNTGVGLAHLPGFPWGPLLWQWDYDPLLKVPTASGFLEIRAGCVCVGGDMLGGQEAPRGKFNYLVIKEEIKSATETLPLFPT